VPIAKAGVERENELSGNPSLAHKVSSFKEKQLKRIHSKKKTVLLEKSSREKSASKSEWQEN